MTQLQGKFSKISSSSNIARALQTSALGSCSIHVLNIGEDTEKVGNRIACLNKNVSY